MTRDSTGYGQTQQEQRHPTEWDLHVTQLMEGPNAFVGLYWMEHASLVKLCRLVEPFVSIDPEMSKV
jgi:hypothetical protein